MISKIESQEINGVITAYYRLTNTSKTKKMLGKFNNFLHEEGIRDELPKGVIGKNPQALPFDRKVIRSDDVNINIIKSKNYYHMIMVFSREISDKVKDCLQEAINAIKK